MFSYKLMIITSSLYASSAHESFHRNAVFLHSGENIGLEAHRLDSPFGVRMLNEWKTRGS